MPAESKRGPSLFFATRLHLWPRWEVPCFLLSTPSLLPLPGTQASKYLLVYLAMEQGYGGQSFLGASCLLNPLDWSGVSLSMIEDRESAKLRLPNRDWWLCMTVHLPKYKHDKICKAWCAVSKSEAKMPGPFCHCALPRCRISVEPAIRWPGSQHTWMACAAQEGKD